MDIFLTCCLSIIQDKAVIATDVETGKLKCCYENAHEEPVYKLLCLGNNKFVTGKLMYNNILITIALIEIKLGKRHYSAIICFLDTYFESKNCLNFKYK